MSVNHSEMKHKSFPKSSGQKSLYFFIVLSKMTISLKMLSCETERRRETKNPQRLSVELEFSAVIDHRHAAQIFFITSCQV